MLPGRWINLFAEVRKTVELSFQDTRLKIDGGAFGWEIRSVPVTTLFRSDFKMMGGKFLIDEAWATDSALVLRGGPGLVAVAQRHH
jgi:hypothetical protein